MKRFVFYFKVAIITLSLTFLIGVYRKQFFPLSIVQTFNVSHHKLINEHVVVKKGVLDRFEDSQAIILLENTSKEIVVSKKALPTGSYEGTWFSIEVVEGQYEIVAIDEIATNINNEKSKRLLKKIQNKNPIFKKDKKWE